MRVPKSEMWVPIIELWVPIREMWVPIREMWVPIGEMWVPTGEMWVPIREDSLDWLRLVSLVGQPILINGPMREKMIVKSIFSCCDPFVTSQHTGGLLFNIINQGCFCTLDQSKIFELNCDLLKYITKVRESCPFQRICQAGQTGPIKWNLSPLYWRWDLSPFLLK